jgi:alcohol dehydrogenase class IV
MKSFNFFMPTQIRFGTGRINELKEVLPPIGKRCLIVSRPITGSQQKTYERINKILKEASIEFHYFDQIVPNPTTDGVEKGIQEAVKYNVDFILGIGGGSVLDSAKLIAFLYNKSGTVNWTEAINKYDNPFSIEEKPASAIPFIAVSTTSGTGSQVTQAAVVTDLDQKNKVTIFHAGLFPSVSIVDPELMLSAPPLVTAATGFDAFTHAFESFLGNLTSPLTESMSLQAIKLVFDFLPRAVNNPNDLEARTQLAWADTLAGMCLANGGADFPHPLGEIIGGICQRIPHGETLAMVYPAFLEYKQPLAKDKFEKVASYLNEEGENKNLIEHITGLLKQVGLSDCFTRANISEEEHKLITNHPLLNLLRPNLATEINKMMIDSLK